MRRGGAAARAAVDLPALAPWCSSTPRTPKPTWWPSPGRWSRTGPRRRAPSRSGTPALVNAIWTEVRRSAGLRRRGQLEIVPLDDDFDRPAPTVDPLERWPGLLAGAVARGVLTPRQVVLIAQTRMEGRPLSEVATALGRPYDAVRKERRRAEAALRQFALAYFDSEEQ